MTMPGAVGALNNLRKNWGRYSFTPLKFFGKVWRRLPWERLPLPQSIRVNKEIKISPIGIVCKKPPRFEKSPSRRSLASAFPSAAHFVLVYFCRICATGRLLGKGWIAPEPYTPVAPPAMALAGMQPSLRMTGLVFAASLAIPALAAAVAQMRPMKRICCPRKDRKCWQSKIGSSAPTLKACRRIPAEERESKYAP